MSIEKMSSLKHVFSFQVSSIPAEKEAQRKNKPAQIFKTHQSNKNNKKKM